jgi:hypothetical protein
MGINIHILSGLVNGAAEAAANKQMINEASGKGRRKKKGSECTPCQAMAKIDATRQRLWGK